MVAPMDAMRVKEEIVDAVRRGDDVGVDALLGRFARVADFEALMSLRRALLERPQEPA
ncbi:hypothetical protein [Streptomyces sp. CB02923]|uniref:hypothetical protein n=1 Tax=Streptomyces sp. CB02923 TaxID=1718985 RepID=UPI000A99A064|nr:hypothetical protein [Streptomyces sp. CB02923]